jgi:hypothetical protein
MTWESRAVGHVYGLLGPEGLGEQIARVVFVAPSASMIPGALRAAGRYPADLLPAGPWIEIGRLADLSSRERPYSRDELRGLFAALARAYRIEAGPERRPGLCLCSRRHAAAYRRYAPGVGLRAEILACGLDWRSPDGVDFRGDALVMVEH